MRALIVWQDIPEDTYFFVLEDIGQEEIGKILQCHGLYWNMVGADTPEMKWLSERLEKETKIPGALSGTFDVIIHTGMIL